ncbi:hypothetical protein ABPG75_001260 [Micractinium tetrahymenae]
MVAASPTGSGELVALLSASSLLLAGRSSGALPPSPRSQVPLPLPWRALTTEEERQRGITYYGSGGRLRKVASKLLAGQPIKVTTLGGSVTVAGVLHRHGRSYSALLFRFINESFPHSGHVFQNGGMPGSSSGFFAPCVEQLVSPDVDLVTLEFAINDKADVPFASPHRKAYEQLIRRLLALPGQPAVVLLHHYAWWMAAGDGAKGGLFYRQPEGQHTILAHYYDLPSVSVRAAVWRLMQAGVEGFKTDKMVRPGSVNPETGKPFERATEEEALSYFYGDIGHPEDAGQQVLAELLVAPLMRAVQQAAVSGRQLQQRRDPRLDGLPPAMIPDNPVGATSICAMLEDFKPVVKAAEGFEFVAHKPSAPTFVEQKWAWTGLQPGSWAELEFDSRSQEGDPEGPAVVLLTHLKSYEGMGVADVTCASGCTCEPGKINSQWSRRASIFSTHEQRVSQHARCRLRVTIRNVESRRGQATQKISLTALMVTHLM